MVDIYLDPWILALPSTDRRSEMTDRYVESLTTIHRLASGGRITGAVTAYAAELLELDELFPLIDRMDQRIWPHRRDIWKLVGAILGRLTSLEDEDGVMSVLVEESAIDTLPDSSFSTARSKAHRAELVARSLSHSRRMITEQGPALLTPMEGEVVEVAGVECLISDAEVTSPRVTSAGSHKGPIRCGGCARKLTDMLSAVDIWRLGRFDDALSLAVYLARPLQQREWPPEQRNWCFGLRFAASARDLNFHSNQTRAEMLLRACVETILGENLADTHALRTSRGANAAQKTRTRDGACAWRRDIDYEFHLHYWKLGSFTEFGSVVVHNDFDIP